MATKDYLIATNQWDLFNDRPYEDRTVQAAQHSTFLRSVQALGDLEEEQPSKGQGCTGCTPQGCGPTCPRRQNEIQMMKEAFCVVEDLVKYMGSRGHHLSHAYSKGQAYLNTIRPLIS